MERTVFVALDTSKKQMAVAVASDEPREPVRYLGQFANTPDALRRLCNKLSKDGSDFISAMRLAPSDTTAAASRTMGPPV